MHVGPTILAAGSVLLAVGLTGLLYRRRLRPAAPPLIAVSGVSALYLLGHTALYVPGPLRVAVASFAGRAFVFGSQYYLQALYTGLVGSLWFLFALGYTGRGDRFLGAASRALALFWGLALTAVAGTWVGGFRYAGRPVFELLLSVLLFSLSGLFILGILLVSETAWRRNPVSTREAGLLAGSAALVAVVSLVSVLVTHPVTPLVVVSLALVGFGTAVRRFPVFSTLPVARVNGRDRLLAEREDPVLVVDERGQVRDRNESAKRAFDLGEGDTRRPLKKVLPEPLDPAAVARREEPAQIQTADGTVLAVTADPVTDGRDRQFGHVLRCTDVTGRQRRERRLRVLHQLLTGRLNEQLSAIAERADTAETDPEAVGEQITADVATLKTLVSRTREVERALADPAPEQVSVPALLSSVADETDGRLAVEPPDERVTATVDEATLRQVVTMLVTDLRAASGGSVSAAVERPPHGPEVHLHADEPDERQSGMAETPASRLGLTRELAQAALQTLGGTVTTVTGDDEVTVVLGLPAAEAGEPPMSGGNT